MTTELNPPKIGKRKCFLISVCSLLILLAFIASIYVSNTQIKTTFYTLESKKITSPVRLAIISDLHSKEFDNNNETLYSQLAELKPDLILAVGDMIADSHVNPQGLESLKKLVSKLCSIAPLYYSLGNHERHSADCEEIKNAIVSSGAVLLENTYEDISLNGNELRLFGLSYYRSWDYEANDFISRCLQSDGDIFSLLLCHHPEFYQWGIKNYQIDLTVSGHTHGGMVKLPLLGPVYAPEQGWFPEYGAGFFEEENGCLAVTTGLGSSPENMPRIFNRPEIMVIDVK